MKKIFCMILFFFLICYYFIVSLEIPILNNQHLNPQIHQQVEQACVQYFPWKNNLLTAYHKLIVTIFQTSLQEQVIYGRKGYLFFAETIHDYIQDNLLDDASLNEIQTILDQVNARLKRYDKKFIVLIVPNKNSIVDTMPLRYRKGKKQSDAQTLCNQRPYMISLFPVLKKANQTQDIYYHKDSHWNENGAYLAYAEVMKKLAMPIPTHQQSQIVRKHKADLCKMLYPASDCIEEVKTKAWHTHYTLTSLHQRVDDSEIITHQKNGKQTLFMIRDSFADHLIPFFSETFQHCYYTKHFPVSLDDERMKKSDVIILEIAQRNLKEIKQCFQK